MMLANAMQTFTASASRTDAAGPGTRDKSADDRSKTDAPVPSFRDALDNAKADRSSAKADKAATKDPMAIEKAVTLLPVASPATPADDQRSLVDVLAAVVLGEQPAAKGTSSDAKSGDLPQDAAGRGDAAERDPDKSATNATAPGTVPVPSLDLSAFLAGSGAQSAPPSPASAGDAPSTDTIPASPGQNEAGAARAGPAVVPPTTGKPLIADVAVQTHLSPVRPDGDASTAANVGNAQATAASPTADTKDAVASAAPFETPFAPPTDRSPRVSDTTPASGTAADEPVPAPASVIEPTAVKEPAAVDKASETALAPPKDIAPVGSLNVGVMPAAVAPLRAITGAVVELAARPAAVAEPQPTTAAPLARTLTLQLSPADLGTVDIRMHVSSGALDVELTMSDTRTYGLVSRERDGLMAAMRESQYSLHSLVIQDGVAPSSGGSHDSSGNLSRGSESRSDGSPGGADSGQRERGGQNRDENRSDRPVPRDPAAARAADRRGGGTLFV